jgi:hypothetical protein
MEKQLGIKTALIFSYNTSNCLWSWFVLYWQQGFQIPLSLMDEMFLIDRLSINKPEGSGVKIIMIKAHKTNNESLLILKSIAGS